MLTLDEARQLCREWNATHTESAFVPMEWAEECLLSLARWQRGIRDFLPLQDLSAELDRHWTFCRRLPDELLLELFEVEEMMP